MRRFLITGGTGFFGQSIRDYVLRNAYDCSISVLSRHRGDIVGDVRTFDVGTARFDCVIHAATPVAEAVSEAEMRSIVVEGTANALLQAKKCGAEKFMMVSSGGVYGRDLVRPASETDVPRPVTAYGQAKLEAEAMAVASGLHVLLPRCFAFVGKHLPRDAHFAIGNFIRDALAGKDIVIRGDGTPMRSFLYDDDLVEWLLAILERGESGRVYNVGSDEAISIRDLAMLVRDVLGSSSEVKVLGQAVAGAANYYVPNVDRIRAELGVVVKTPLAEAIRLSVSREEGAS